MHQHDQDLIMALAEETLDDAAAAAARAEIAACEQCARDFELQQFAISVLGDAPTASLTEMESARLRRAVRQELGVAKVTKFEPSKKRRRMPMAALATAAAVLVGVVIIGPGLQLIGSDDAGGDTIVAEAAPSTTAASALDAPAAVGGAETQEDAAEGTAAPQTTFAAAPTTTLFPSDPSLLGYYPTPPDLAALRLSMADSGYDEESVRSFVLRDAGETVREQDLNTVAACIVVTLSNSDEFFEGFQVAKGQLDDRDVIYVVYLAESLDESALVVQDAATCEELGRAGP